MLSGAVLSQMNKSDKPFNGMPDMKLNRITLFSFAALMLTGCGGGSSGSNTPAQIGSAPTPAPVTQSAYDQATNKARDDFQARLNELQAAADSWMQTNGNKADVITTASGLQYKINRQSPASNAAYIEGQAVKVHYEGRLTDGTIFDSSYQRGRPENLTPADLVEGWQEALRLMSPGDEWTLFLPPSLAYGKRGYGSDIPANAVLIFDVELR